MEYILKNRINMTSIHTKKHSELVERLKKARKDAGLDQKEAAKLLRKTQSYISKIESGQRKIDVVDLLKFGEIYKKSISYFIE